MPSPFERLQEKAARIAAKKQEVETPPETTREEFLQAQKDYLQTLIEGEEE